MITDAVETMAVATESQAYVPQDLSAQSSSTKSVAVDHHVEYNYDLTQAPLNKKLILLTIGGIGVFGQLHGDHRDRDILGWFPMMARNPEKEKEAWKRIQVQRQS